jgi:hypothetical protein
MRNLISILALFLLLGSAPAAYSQCNVELYSQRSLKSLQPGFMFVKSFRIDGKDGSRRKIEYTCVFSKGMSYQIHITAADGEADGIVGTLYNPERKRLASNHLDGKFYKVLQYNCNATGIYYLSFTFRESASFCGAAILSFKRS